MKHESEAIQASQYAVGEKWFNTENGVEFYITEITENIVSLNDGKKKLNSFEHMNKSLWNNLVSIGVFRPKN